MTLQKTDPAGADTTTLVVRTEDVQTFAGYPGHLITVTAHVPDPGNPNHSIASVLATERPTGADDNRKEVVVDLTGVVSPAFVSVRVQVDAEVPPGLYDDFVVTRLQHRSAGFTFGFRA